MPRSLTANEQTALLESLVHTAPIGFAFLDRDLKLMRVNKLLADINKVEASDIIGRDVREAFPNAEKRIIRIMEQVVKTGEPVFNVSIERPAKEPGQEYSHYIAHYYPVRNEADEVSGLGVVVRDVTDRTKVIHELRTLEANLSYLSEASKVLSTSLDYLVTLKMVAQLAVPKIADWCSIDLINSEGLLEQVVIAHQDPEKVKWAEHLHETVPRRIDETQGIGKVLKTGESEFYARITPELLEQATAKITPEEMKVLQQLDIKSLMIVPIFHNGRPIGAITFVSAESGRYYTENDLDMAEELAARASLAIENSLLYEKVKNEQDRLRDMLASVPGVVWEAWGEPDDSGQKINFVSDYVEKMLGYTVEEWLATPNFWLSIVHPEDKEHASATAKKTFDSGKLGVNRFRWMRKDGKPVWVEAHSYAIKNKKGKKVGMRGVTMDISDRVGIEKQKDEFLGIVSHELKTPVTSLKAYAQVLHRRFVKRNDEHSAKQLAKMDNQLNKLTTLISDLLDTTRIESGKFAFNTEIFEIDDLIKETAELMQLTTEQHKVVMHGTCDVKVEGDRERVGQVLTNLISNAIKYSPESDRVDIHLEKVGEKIQVCVQDFGEGISEDDQARIFDRFYRVGSKRQETSPGLGLGLYISSQIVQRQKGELWVESELGKGSTFCFTLPIYQKVPQKKKHNKKK